LPNLAKRFSGDAMGLNNIIRLNGNIIRLSGDAIRLSNIIRLNNTIRLSDIIRPIII